MKDRKVILSAIVGSIVGGIGGFVFTGGAEGAVIGVLFGGVFGTSIGPSIGRGNKPAQPFNSRRGRSKTDIQCVRCKTDNPPDVQLCIKCGRRIQQGEFYLLSVIGSAIVVTFSILSFYFIRNSERGSDIWASAAALTWWAGASLSFITLITALFNLRKALTAAAAIGMIALASSCFATVSGGHLSDLLS